MSSVKIDNNLLSVDLGYSSAKYFFKINGKEHYGKIDNAVLKLDSDTARTDFFVFNGTKYAIGKDIIDKGYSELSLSVDDLIDYSPLFIAKIIQDNNIEHSNLNLITGLSFKDADKTTRLIDKLKRFIIDDIEYNIKIDLLPQGRGIAYDFANKIDDYDDISWNIIMDIGYHTFDFVSINKGKLDRDDTFANNQGVNLILNEVVEELKKQGIEKTTAEINNLICENKKYVHYRGNKISFDDILDKAIENYFNEIKKTCINHKTAKKRLDNAELIILGGGGAYLFDNKQDIIKKVFDATISFTDKPYEYSNARGYYIRNEKRNG